MLLLQLEMTPICITIFQMTFQFIISSTQTTATSTCFLIQHCALELGSALKTKMNIGYVRKNTHRGLNRKITKQYHKRNYKDILKSTWEDPTKERMWCQQPWHVGSMLIMF